MSTNYLEKNITVGGALALIADYDVEGTNVLVVQMTNIGPGALNAFELRGSGVKDSYQAPPVLKDSGFIVPDFHVLFTSGEPGRLAADASVLMYFNVALLQSVELWARSASSSDLVVAAFGV
ncbi:hypothetical protein [Methylocaldum szegediense]|uniref:hypothetical protein n=1 Tax=Methylocaldum szegediense TaxID=73780 RepID=UPI0003F7A16E|nr:hypothetical protein [Methylocaldum szegediense]